MLRCRPPTSPFCVTTPNSKARPPWGAVPATLGNTGLNKFNKKTRKTKTYRKMLFLKLDLNLLHWFLRLQFRGHLFEQCNFTKCQINNALILFFSVLGAALNLDLRSSFANAVSFNCVTTVVDCIHLRIVALFNDNTSVPVGNDVVMILLFCSNS